VALGVVQGELPRFEVAADIHARPPGTVPGGWHRWAESVLPSRTDWRRALAAEVRRGVTYASGAVDYSYRRPARRSHLNDDIVLPSLMRPVPDIASSATPQDRCTSSCWLARSPRSKRS
jgi:Putative metallopeptidase domain